MALTAPGLGSGLDVNSLVSQLMALERRPITALDRKEASFQAQLTAFGTLKGALSSLQSAAKSLATAEKFAAKRATVADATLLSVAASTSAAAGSYSVEVQSLAQSQKLKSGEFSGSTATVGEGTITITFGRYSTSGADTIFTPNAGRAASTITISNSQNTLAGIRDAINAANAGVTATIVNEGAASRLTLTSTSPGLDNELRVTVADNDGDNTNNAGLSKLAYEATDIGGIAGPTNLTQTVDAEDAVVFVDGIKITRSTNTITDAIDGLTLTLLKQAPGTTSSFSVSRDSASISTAVQSFVKAYNDTAKSFRDLAGYNAATNTGGVLVGDSTVRSIQSQMRDILFASVSTGVTGIQTLSDVGVSFQTDGTLALSATKLDSALTTSSSAVGTLFSSATGVATRLADKLDAVLNSAGVIGSRTDGLSTTIKDIGRRRELLEVRMTQIERRYRAQFTALDTMVASMTQTSSFLQQQLANLPTINRGGN